MAEQAATIYIYSWKKELGHLSEYYLLKGFEIPAYEKYRIFELKSVVGFCKDSLINVLVEYDSAKH